MMTIAWYNAVAIIIGIVALGCTFFLPKDKGGMMDGIAMIYGWFAWTVLVMLFYAIWGGIYWW